jgi:hypothetical protein
MPIELVYFVRVCSSVQSHTILHSISVNTQVQKYIEQFLKEQLQSAHLLTNFHANSFKTVCIKFVEFVNHLNEQMFAELYLSIGELFKFTYVSPQLIYLHFQL